MNLREGYPNVLELSSCNWSFCSSSCRINGPSARVYSSLSDSSVYSERFIRCSWQPCAHLEFGSVALHIFTLQCRYTNWWSPINLKAWNLKRSVAGLLEGSDMTVLSTPQLKGDGGYDQHITPIIKKQTNLHLFRRFPIWQ